VLYRRYAAVVGNPPYITVKDAVLRERYREMYVSAAGKYSLAAPFAERFFQLARGRGGRVGMITANSFMKREFGKKLIEEYLPTVNLDLIVNTSGAYIPGHGTPTVLLFGTSGGRAGQADVLAVLAKRGEPTRRTIPSRGWSGAALPTTGARSASRTTTSRWRGWSERERSRSTHGALGGGGASDLKELLEEGRAERRLVISCDSIGRFVQSRARMTSTFMPARTLGCATARQVDAPPCHWSSVRHSRLESCNHRCRRRDASFHTTTPLGGPGDRELRKPMTLVAISRAVTSASARSFGGSTNCKAVSDLV
jgi:hypothetical protein